MAPIPDHVLVLGLARSGTAAVAALRRAGSDVTAYDANADLDVAEIDGRSPSRRAGTTRSSTASSSSSRAPAFRHDAPPVAAARRPRDPGHLGDRARSPPAREPDHRDHGDERQDDDDGAARRDVRGCRDACRGRGQHRPAADEPGRDERRPTRGSCASSPRSSSRTSRRSTAGSRCCSTSSRITSTVTDRSTTIATRSSASSSGRTADDLAIVPRGFGAVPGDGAPARVRRATTSSRPSR